MPFPVRPEWSTASVGSSHAPTDAVDHSAPSAIRPESTYISGKVVQINGATSDSRYGPRPRIIRSPIFPQVCVILWSFKRSKHTPLQVVQIK